MTMKTSLFSAWAVATMLAATSCSNGAVTLQTSSVDDVVKAMTKEQKPQHTSVASSRMA